MSSEDPDRRSFVERLAALENIRFRAFGVRSGWQEDNSKLVDDLHLAASPQMAELSLIKFPLSVPDSRNPDPHFGALCSIFKITDLMNTEGAIEYCRLYLTSPHPSLPYTIMALGSPLLCV